MRITLLLLPGGGALIALAATIALAASRTAAPPPIRVAADDAARALGILGFEVTRDAPAALEVQVEGAAAGHLGVRATQRERGREIEQRLDGFGAPFVLRTRRDAVALGRAGAERLVARRDLGAWTGAPIPAAEAENLARVLALDTSLAVQGSSLVFGGTAYVACTVRCTRAEACVRSSPRGVARCAEDLVVCAACLERTP